MNKLKIVPLRFNVLIEVDKVDKMAGSFHKTDKEIDKEQYSMNRGTLVSVGQLAFKEWKETAPQIGDSVLFDMYKGVMIPYSEEIPLESEHHSGTKIETSFFRVCLDTEVLGRIVEVEDGS